MIGTCTLFRIDPRHRHAEIGYALRSDHWGQGLAHEAVNLMLDWAFRRSACIGSRPTSIRATRGRVGCC